jgi:hypothetical protein
MRRSIGWLGIAAGTFHDLAARYGSANEPSAVVPRDWWLAPWEKAATLEAHAGHRLECHRRLAFMMLDADVVEGMTEADVETIIQRVRAPLLGEPPGINSDNGPQFIARDFNEFIRICGMTRHGRSLLGECRRPAEIAFASPRVQEPTGPVIVPLGCRPPPGLVPGMTVGPSSEPLGMGPPPGFVPGRAVPSSGPFIDPLRIGPPPGFVPGRAVPPWVLYVLAKGEITVNAAGLNAAPVRPPVCRAVGTTRARCACTLAW